MINSLFSINFNYALLRRQRLKDVLPFNNSGGEQRDIRARAVRVQCEVGCGDTAAAQVIPKRCKSKVLKWAIWLLIRLWTLLTYTFPKDNVERNDDVPPFHFPLLLSDHFYRHRKLCLCIPGRIAEQNRAVRETEMNQSSSRSHSIFQVKTQDLRCLTL